MHSKQVKLINGTGLHARPAAEFNKVATTFMSDIFIEKTNEDNSRVNAKSVVNIISMDIDKGTEIKISAEGIDEMDKAPKHGHRIVWCYSI